MYFEGRELKPYGEFVKASDLVVGRVYFRVSYLDQEMMIPELVPLVFIGRNLSSEHPGLYYQDAESFFAGKRWGGTNDEAMGAEDDDARDDAEGWFETESERTYSQVFEFEKALDGLLGCSLRRRQWDGQVRLPDPHEDQE
jgi:hypothetical protein